MAITSGATLVAVRYARLADEKNQARWNKKRQKERMVKRRGSTITWGGVRERERERESERERETTRRKGGWAKGRWVASNARMKGLGRTMENQDEGSPTAWPTAIESKQSDDRPSKYLLLLGTRLCPCIYVHTYAFVLPGFSGCLPRTRSVTVAKSQRDCLVNTALERRDVYRNFSENYVCLVTFSFGSRWNGHFSI